MKIRRFIRLGHGARDLWRSGEDTDLLPIPWRQSSARYFLDSDAGLGVVRQCIVPGSNRSLRRIRREELPKKKVRPRPFSNFQTCRTQRNETAVATTVG